MDRKSLITLFLTGFLVACASKGELHTSKEAATTIRSPLAPVLVVEESQKFLEWEKGYNIRIRDTALGILVTDWIEDSPVMRHQFTIRVNRDVSGSLLTAHVVLEQFMDGKWRQVLAAPQWEAGMIQQLRNHLDAKAAQIRP